MGQAMGCAATKGNGALTSLDLSKNRLCAKGTKILAEALKRNQIMTALNISSNDMTYGGKGKGHGDISGVAALAGAIPGMGAMTSLNRASTQLCAEDTKLLAAALKGNQIMTERNISSNRMTYGSAWGDMSGIIILANVIPDMGTIDQARYWQQQYRAGPGSSAPANHEVLLHQGR
jgi:hypothetical protein